jgi:membrane-bound lytic murein transglycosylase B
MGVQAPKAEARDFGSWLQGVRAEARAHGVSEKTIKTALPDTLRPVPRIIVLDRRQPEVTMTLQEYVQGLLTPQRIGAGRTHYRTYLTTLREVANNYGVDPEYIVALWSIETNFGKNMGRYRVVEALATLAYDGRRSGYFRSELMKALQILDEGDISVGDMKGSWAGAMGQTQFMPTSFVRFAQDFNKDGRKDIWNSQADVFASAANYLARSGWKRGQPWGRRVKLPQGFDGRLIGLDKKHSLQFWRDHEIRLANGGALPLSEAEEASLIQPDGAGTAAYIVYNNYRVTLKWNNSTYFATAVGLLADRIRDSRT